MRRELCGGRDAQNQGAISGCLGRIKKKTGREMGTIKKKTPPGSYGAPLGNIGEKGERAGVPTVVRSQRKGRAAVGRVDCFRLKWSAAEGRNSLQYIHQILWGCVKASALWGI